MSRPSVLTVKSDSAGDYIVETFTADNARGVVIGVAGFGKNRYDGHDLFKDIAESLTDYTVVLIDLNQIVDGRLTANPLSVQIARFNTELAVQLQQPLPVSLIGHSMGCIVISRSNATNLPTLFLAPAVRDITTTLKTHLLARPATKVDSDDTIHAQRSDGSITTIPVRFWEEASQLHLVDAYTDACGRLPISLIVAGQDEILKAESQDLQQVPFASSYLMPGADHDLSGDVRPELISRIQQFLQ